MPGAAPVAPATTPSVAPALLSYIAGMKGSDGKPVAAPGWLPPGASVSGGDPAAVAAKKAVLEKIASGEAHSYNEVYNGPAFTDYSQHPAQRHVITEGPHKGETSDAAGMYQFLSSTYNPIAAKLRLKDFSPASQDAAAWDLAETTYKQTTGRDLLADAQAGKVDYSKLAGKWPSLAGGGSGGGGSRRAPDGGGGEGAVAVRAARERTAGAAGASTPTTVVAPDGTIVASGPVSPTELFAGQMKLQLLKGLFPQHKISQVEYDPFKVMPKAPERVNVNEGVG